MPTQHTKKQSHKQTEIDNSSSGGKHTRQSLCYRCMWPLSRPLALHGLMNLWMSCFVKYWNVPVLHHSFLLLLMRQHLFDQKTQTTTTTKTKQHLFVMLRIARAESHIDLAKACSAPGWFTLDAVLVPWLSHHVHPPDQLKSIRLPGAWPGGHGCWKKVLAVLKGLN